MLTYACMHAIVLPSSLRFLRFSRSAVTMAASFHVRLVRHGETDDNVRRVIASHTPSPLNATGQRQADALGAAWRDEGATFRRVYSSDTCRVLETCQRALAAAGAGPEPAPRV